MNYTKRIEELMNTDMTNRMIASAVGCSMRMVQHVAGGYKERRGLLQNEINSKLPKVLLFDIETSPMEFYGWQLFKQTVLPHQVIKDWSTLCWSAKWLNEPEIMNGRVKPKEAINREDMSIMQGIWDLIDEADITITHNGKAFDHKKTNARFLNNGFGPPSPYQMIDTKIESGKNFMFSSNSLDWLCKIMDVDQKKNPQGFPLWVDCVHGDKKALKRMQAYCDQDVRALEDVYMMIRPWIRSHPNMGIFVECDEPVCPTCASLELDYTGYYRTMVSNFRAFRCKSCRSIGRLRKSDISRDVRNSLTISTAR